MHGVIHLFDSLPQVDGSQAASAGQPCTPSFRPGTGDPRIGLIRNRRSHGNERAQAEVNEIPGVIVATPSQRSELPQIMADFASRGVDVVAIDGGDGTVRDVITCGASAFGECWPALIVLPSGKTNALAWDLGIRPGWSLADAMEALRRESFVVRRPIVVAQRDNPSAQVRGFVLGAGAYTQAISLGQDAHDFGAFNAAAVGVTTAWSVLQAMFGRAGNPWRRGTRMRLRDADGHEFRHVGTSPADERYMIFASTLERFPAGLQPFRGIDAPMRIAVLDNARRSVLLRLPAIFRGRAGEGTRRMGFQAHGLEAFDFDIDDRFILDGEAFPPGSYSVKLGPRLHFVVP